MRLNIALLFFALMLSGCSQIENQSKYLTVDQYVKTASYMKVPSTEINLKHEKQYLNALYHAIQTAPKSAYSKHGKPYSKIDYWCANHFYLDNKYNNKSHYKRIEGNICFNTLNTWVNIGKPTPKPVFFYGMNTGLCNFPMYIQKGKYWYS